MLWIKYFLHTINVISNTYQAHMSVSMSVYVCVYVCVCLCVLPI